MTVACDSTYSVRYTISMNFSSNNNTCYKDPQIQRLSALNK